MTADTAPVVLSPLEEERFGVRTARAPEFSTKDLPAIEDFCRSNEVQLLIARCRTSDLVAAQAMEAAGGLLMDTLVYYARDLVKKPLEGELFELPIRPVRREEEEIVAEIAAATFKGYTGHYHADPRLDGQKCDDVYTSWTRNSILERKADTEVLVVELEGAPAGFATLRMNSAEEGEGVLFGVAPRAQGRGIYRGFILAGIEWCQAQSAQRMVVSTQVTNLAVQKVWVRTGFEPSGSFYTFHRWFDDAPAQAAQGNS